MDDSAHILVALG
uniref:Uncharacterized protein n=1 Tax=Rhizophora mucronata TaxID=61149 RepID=A0A2P2NSU3_RHIMU